MKNITKLVFAITIGLCINFVSVINASTPLKIAVLPFEINAAENFDFLKDGIQTMLSSRLSWDDKSIVIDKNRVNKAADSVKNFTGKSRALLIGAKLKADYIIYGSLTIIGDNTSIDAKITDITGKKSPASLFSQTSSMGQVIPEINRFATKINEIIFNRTPLAKFQTDQPAKQLSVQSAPQHTQQPVIKTSQRLQQQLPLKSASDYMVSTNNTTPEVQQSVVTPNKSFIPVNPTNHRNNYWKSGTFNELIKGMDFGDVNNDGIAETVLISDHQVYLYRASNNQFTKIAEIAKNRLNHYIGVDVADINQNGIPEIFVSGLSPDKNRINSLVIEYNGSKYVKIVENSPWLYRTTGTGQGVPLLLGQKMKHKKENIFASPVFIMDWNKKNYISSERILDKKQGNILGIAYDNILEAGKKNIIAFDQGDYLSIFKNRSRKTWTGSTKFGGNMSYFSMPREDPSELGQNIQYFPMRIRTADSDQDGRLEVITACNYDIAKGLLKDFRSFSKTHIEALAWDGLGLSTIWKTRTMTGRITDFFIEDFDNDGVKEMVISLVTKEGHTAFSTTRSIIIAYELTAN